MTYIYIVRHCEAEGNILKIYQGITDMDITKQGEKQLEKLEERFNDINLDAVYTSPLIRTVKTANAIKGSKEIPIIEDKGLIEISGGIIEGKPFKECFEEIDGFYDMWYNRPEDLSLPQSEPMAAAYERIYNTVLKIAKENDGKTIACATHGGVIRCLICKILYDNIKKLKDVLVPINTAVTLLKIDEKQNIKLEFFNDYSHLDESLYVDIYNKGKLK